jgi:glycosyltransferase involved in cell wall biosynthesis
LLTRSHPSFTLRVKTFLHFIEGVLAAYYLRELEIDQIHAHFIDRAAIVALCASRLLKLPYSLTAHADEIFEEPILIYEKISESKFTITVSEFNKNYLLSNYPELDPDKIIILHPWVDINLFKSPGGVVENTKLRIISVGRLVENKGHEYLIKACQQLKNEGVEFECNIIGEGPLFDDLHNLIVDLELASFVKLFGGQPQTVVINHLEDSDIFVLAAIIASSGKRDGMPVAIAEAMAMELPVISSDIVGIGEMVRPSAGLLVPPKDPNALAKAMLYMWEQGPKIRQEFGKEGRKIILENFDLYKGIDQLSELFLPTALHDKPGK